MLGIIGKKIGMTRVYDQAGRSTACTVVQVGPCTVTQIRSEATDGYEAVQLAYQEKKQKNTTKPLQGHFKKAQTTPKKKMVEFKNFVQDYPKDSLQLGATINSENIFEEGEYLDVTGYAKGKGFQGVVKRHGFSGVGDRTHGQHNRERAPGAIGACSTPSRVFKGMRMAGRMGGQRVKVKNLKVMKIIPENHLILLGGAVPGAKNGYITLHK